jgi:hypothetical protein
MKQHIYIALLCKFFLCVAAEIIWYNWKDICRFIKGEPPIEYIHDSSTFEADCLFWCIMFIPSLLQLCLEFIIVKRKKKTFNALLVCNIISIDFFPQYFFLIVSQLLGGVRGLFPFVYVWIAVKFITLTYIYNVQNKYLV